MWSSVVPWVDIHRLGFLASSTVMVCWMAGTMSYSDFWSPFLSLSVLEQSQQWDHIPVFCNFRGCEMICTASSLRIWRIAALILASARSPISMLTKLQLEWGQCLGEVLRGCLRDPLNISMSSSAKFVDHLGMWALRSSTWGFWQFNSILFLT